MMSELQSDLPLKRSEHFRHTVNFQVATGGGLIIFVFNTANK